MLRQFMFVLWLIEPSVLLQPGLKPVTCTFRVSTIINVGCTRRTPTHPHHTRFLPAAHHSKILRASKEVTF
jgi:hypothetical protein